MARKLPTLVIPQTASIPPANITAPEWLPVQRESQLTSTQRFDVRHFGDIGAADDAATFNAAINAVHTNGGGVVVAPAGHYTFTSGVELKHGVSLDFTGSGSTHLDFSGLSSPVNNAAIYGSGELVPLPALGANVALHDREVTFASAPDLAPGDVFMMYNSTDRSFNTARAEYRAGEYCRVAAVSGSTVTLTSPTYDAYTAGANIQMYRLDPIRTGITGARITFRPGYSGIRVSMGSGLRFDDLDLSGSNINHLFVDRCYDINLSEVRAFDAGSNTGMNYGVLLGNSQRIRMRDCDLETTRHGFTTGGANGVGSIPNRDIIVNGGRLSGMGNSGQAGVALHGNAEDVHFIGVHMPNGIVPAGKSGSIRNCNIWSDSSGLAVYFAELLSPDWTIEGNHIKATANHSASFALFLVELREHATVGGGTLRIANNVIDLGPYGWTNDLGSYALRIRNLSASAATNNVLDIENNMFLTTRTVGNDDFAIRQDSNQSTHGFNAAYVHNNKNPRNLRMAQAGTLNAPWHFIGAGIGAPTFRARIGSEYTRYDAGGANVKYIATATTDSDWQRVVTEE